MSRSSLTRAAYGQSSSTRSPATPLKLITIARQHPGARLIVAFGDEAARGLRDRQELAGGSTAHLGRRGVAVSLEEEVRAGLVEAQARQVMVNPTWMRRRVRLKVTGGEVWWTITKAESAP